MKKFTKKKQANCQVCGIPIQVPLETYNKNIKEGKHFFCSPQCSNQQETPKLVKIKPVEDIFMKNYKTILSTKTPIRVSMNDIKEQWNIQRGICSFSGLELTDDDSINNGILIRKDKTKEFTKDNITWVCQGVMLMKSLLSDEDIITISKKIVANL